MDANLPSSSSLTNEIVCPFRLGQRFQRLSNTFTRALPCGTSSYKWDLKVCLSTRLLKSLWSTYDDTY